MRRAASTILLAIGVACRPEPKPGTPAEPPALTEAAPARMSVEVLRERQAVAARESGLYPKRGANLYVYAARDLVQGRQVSLADLPVDYWRWPLPWYLASTGKADRGSAEAWFQRWLELEQTEWRTGWPYGSLNHQLARGGGLYAALSVLGPDGAARSGNDLVLSSPQRIRDVLGGQWWDGYGVWEGQRTPPAGSHPETTRSRHYAARNWTYLWAIADLGAESESTLAAQELDVAWEKLRGGLRPDGLWDEEKLPRYRPEKDQLFLAETWSAFGLSCHPSQTPVLSYILFERAPFRPEFQGHARKGEDERHEQWSDYVFVGGLRWRPPADR
ncbi:MAG: hypothetical protein U0166_02155 [Acidobacteriota bacterium]